MDIGHRNFIMTMSTGCTMYILSECFTVSNWVINITISHRHKWPKGLNSHHQVTCDIFINLNSKFGDTVYCLTAAVSCFSQQEHLVCFTPHIHWFCRSWWMISLWQMCLVSKQSIVNINCNFIQHKTAKLLYNLTVMFYRKVLWTNITFMHVSLKAFWISKFWPLVSCPSNISSDEANWLWSSFRFIIDCQSVWNSTSNKAPKLH